MNMFKYALSLRLKNQTKVPTKNKLNCKKTDSESVRAVGEDTIQVVVFNPHETHSSMGQDGRERALFLFIHQQGHKMLDLWHVHIAAVITTDKDLKNT